LSEAKSKSGNVAEKILPSPLQILKRFRDIDLILIGQKRLGFGARAP
jgi:hypothetical protein